ncbi:MAG: TIGR04283 family arsenosugar biosynthesis glycosyltransferase [Acidobacteriota bacterium]
MRLQIVIPTLDEATALATVLPHALALADEVCVSDGGSRDGTVDLAESAGATVVEGPAGRGGQLNRGAAAGRGDVLLFLHADTVLPTAAPEAVRSCLAGGAVGGGFRLHYDTPSRLMRLGGRIANWRARLSGPLGDQAQFARRDVFEAVGGFPEWPILEDLELMRRLRRRGRVRILDEEARTSVRRFERQGVARTVAINYLIWGLFVLGVPPRRLAGLYRVVR